MFELISLTTGKAHMSLNLKGTAAAPLVLDQI
jgi:hypothetical protein